jgi:hypothetical protein
LRELRCGESGVGSRQRDRAYVVACESKRS